MIGAGSWELARRHIFKPKIETITVTKTEVKFIKTPDNADYDTLKMWAKSPIVNEITFKGDQLFVHSYDMNKSTDTTAKIQVSESSNFKYYVAGGIVVAGVVTYALLK
jgi:imidazoleglycerol phosphate synthase glutamine amidotransferase subunit HisH